MAILRVRPGPVIAGDNSYPEIRGTRKGAMGVQDIGGRYEEAAFRGNVFSGFFASAALAAIGANALSAFSLANPLNSGKILSLIDISMAVTSLTAVASGTAACLCTLPNASQNPTSVGAGNTPVCSLIGSGNQSVAKLYVSGTIVGTPVAFRTLLNAWQGSTAATYGPAIGFYKDEIAGAILILPGGFVQINGVGGTPADVSIEASMTWEELPYVS